MAIISGMFNSINGDRRYNASWFARYFATFIGNGVFPNPSTGLQVLEGENMTTTVKAGDGWINGYFITNDSDYILQHDLADGVLKRIDRIVMRLNHLSRQIEVDIKKGAPASIPVAPNLQRDADAYELGLADVLINNGATQITQANITDLRLNTELCGIVHGTVEQVDTTTLFNQYLTWLEEKKTQYDTDMLGWTERKRLEYENWKAQQETEMDDWQAQEQFEFENWRVQEKSNFDAWFADIQGLLEGDVATNLAGRITNLENDFTSHLADYAHQLGDVELRTNDKTLKGAINELYDFKLDRVKIYGVEIDETNSNPETSVTYTDDAVGLTPARGNDGAFTWGSWEKIIKDEFKIKPVVLENIGGKSATVKYELQYDDYTKKVDGSDSDLTGNDGDVMVEFGTPLWWKFTRIGNKLKIQLSNEEFDGAIKPAFEIEDGYNQVSIYPLFLTQILYLLMFRNLDSQTALGRGNTSDPINYLNTGGTNTKTFNYGETTGRLQMKFLGMEDFWGNRRWWIDGFHYDFLRIIWIGKGGFNNLGDGYENFGIASETDLNGYMDKVQGGNNTGFIPASTSGSWTTYYSDCGILVGGRQVIFGGASGAGNSAGVFYFHSTPASYHDPSFGGRLFYSRNGKIYIGAYLGSVLLGFTDHPVDVLHSVSGMRSQHGDTIGEFRVLATRNNYQEVPSNGDI